MADITLKEQVTKSQNTIKKKSKKRGKNRLRRKNKRKNIAKTQNNLESAYKNYSIWEMQSQISYWRTLAISLQKENEQLKLKLNNQNLYDTENSSQYESSDESEDSTDKEYLEFLVKSEEHRIELKMKRDIERENQSKNLTFAAL